ncbi:MAG: argininosuccinate synthase [Deltaproteobacteria bacterium]|nr:argininosuccinate synthase [Deltaproteobacteria bacterium]
MKLQDLKGEKLGVCVSGGLDSKTVALRLREADLDILGFTADLAQPDESDINDVARRMATTGTETVIVDLKAEMAEACFMMIKAQAMYDGGYWNTTGIARAVTVQGLLGPMKERGCTVLVHGATGRGNDQIRFERYTNTLAPDMKVYAPWRDDTLLQQFPGRLQMAAYLQTKGLEAKVEKKRYSTDANLAGLSHEAEDLEDLTTGELIVDPEMGVWPHQAPDTMEEFSARFSRGRCVEINGTPVTALEAMLTANEIGGRNGIGMRNALENRVIGTKSRGVYEAPGLELLGYCLRAVYQTTMDRRSTGLFHAMSRLIAEQVYDARLFDPGARAALAGIDVLAGYASATVNVKLYRGNIYFVSLTDCDATLYNPADASMEASDGLDPRSAQGFVEVQACEALNLARAGQIANPFWGAGNTSDDD